MSIIKEDVYVDQVVELISTILKKNGFNDEYGGGFTFLVLDRINNDLTAEFKPINKDLAERNKKKFVSSEVREKVGCRRPFNSTYHYQQSVNDFSTLNHFNVNINNLSFLTRSFQDINIDNINDEEINNLDFCFFKIDDDQENLKLIKIPLPFLSSPIALLVVKNHFAESSNDFTIQDQNKFVNEIITSTREFINQVAYTQLINNLQNRITEFYNHDEIISGFSTDLSDILLPKTITIKKNNILQKEIKYNNLKDEYYSGYGGRLDSKFKLLLSINNGDQFEVQYKLPTFCIPVINHPESTCKWIHKTNEYEIRKNQTRKILTDIFNLIYNQWEQQNKAKKSALQSAVSQIFARNYAHNIGSHVKVNAGLVKQVERINELYKNDGNKGYDPLRIESINLAEDLLIHYVQSSDHKTLIKIRKYLKRFIKKNSNVLDIDLNNILGILAFHKKLLNEYEIQRNEFISNPKMPPLNKKLFKEVLAPFVENTLLMDNLCKSEGVRYEKDKRGIVNKLKINFLFTFEETGAKAAVKIAYPQLKKLIKRTDINEGSGVENRDNSVEYPDAFPYLIDSIRETESKGLSEYTEVLKGSYSEKVLYFDQKEGENISWEKFNDVEVALPGAHPLYSILENFIRNSSKHNAKKIDKEKDGELQIFFDIREEESSYRIFLYDNVSDLNDDKLLKMYDSLETSLLDEENDYTPKNSNLGMFDKRINAHLLSSAGEITNENLRNSITLYRFNRENGLCGNAEKVDDDVIQEIENSDEESKNVHPIALSFHIAKAKKICLIGFQSDIIVNVREDLKKEGIYFFENVSSYQEFNKREDISIAAWEFAVMSSDILNDDRFFEDAELFNEDTVAKNFEKFANDLPFRILIEMESVNEEDPSSKVKQVLNLLIRRRRIQHTCKRFDFDTILKNQKEGNSEDPRIANNMLDWCWQNWLMRWTKDELTDDKESCSVTLAVFPDIGTDTGKKEENIWKNIQKELENDQDKGPNLFKLENVSFHLETDPSVVNEFNDNQKVIIYDQHGIWSKSQSDRTKDSDFDKIIHNGFYEVFSKNSEDFVHVFYPPEDPFERKIFCYQLLEAGLCKVSVMDERLNSYMFKNTFANSDDHILSKSGLNSLQNCDYADVANLFQLDGTNHENILKNGKTHTKENGSKSKNASKREIYVNEDNQGIEYLEQNIENKLAESIDIKYKGSDVLIIHRTFLKNEMWSKKNISCEQILNSLRKYYPFVIVISGGGKPNLEEDFKYKPYNLYKDLFGDQVNKWSIVRYSML